MVKGELGQFYTTHFSNILKGIDIFTCRIPNNIEILFKLSVSSSFTVNVNPNLLYILSMFQVL